MNANPPKIELVAPPEDGPEDLIAYAIRDAEEMIRDSIDQIIHIRDTGNSLKPSFLGADYDEAYAQGRKDACRVVLIALGRTDPGETTVTRG